MITKTKIITSYWQRLPKRFFKASNFSRLREFKKQLAIPVPRHTLQVNVFTLKESRFANLLKKKKSLLGPVHSHLSFHLNRRLKFATYSRSQKTTIYITKLQKLLAKTFSKLNKQHNKKTFFRSRLHNRPPNRNRTRPYLFFTKKKFLLRKYLLPSLYLAKRYSFESPLPSRNTLFKKFRFYSFLSNKSKQNTSKPLLRILRVGVRTKLSFLKAFTKSPWSNLNFFYTQRKRKTKKRPVFLEFWYLKTQLYRRIRTIRPSLTSPYSRAYSLKKSFIFLTRKHKKRHFVKTLASLQKTRRVQSKLLGPRKQAFFKLAYLRDKFLQRKGFIIRESSLYSQKRKRLLKSLWLQPFFTHTFRLPLYGFFFLTHRVIQPIRSVQISMTVSAYSFIASLDFKKFLLSRSKPLALSAKLFLTKSYSRCLIPNSTSFGQSENKTSFPLHSNLKTVSKLKLGTNVFPIKRIRFKPGYSRIWRTARSSLQSLLSLKFLYQKQLTRFLVKFYNLANISLLSFYELKVVSVLASTRLIPDISATTFALNHSLVYVNGLLCTNPTLILTRGDVLQLVISVKFYVLFKWLKNWMLQKKIRLIRFLEAKQNKIWNPTSTLISKRFPKWLMGLFFYESDIPKYLEVDYFSLSVTLLYEPFYTSDFNPLLWQMSKKKILNMYNWKYLN